MGNVSSRDHTHEQFEAEALSLTTLNQFPHLQQGAKVLLAPPQVSPWPRHSQTLTLSVLFIQILGTN